MRTFSNALQYIMFGIANSSENVKNKAKNNVINNVKITVTKNYNNYIDNNDKKELIMVIELISFNQY